MHKNLNRLRSKSETSHAFLKTVMMNRLRGFLQALYKSVTEHFLCVSVNARLSSRVPVSACLPIAFLTLSLLPLPSPLPSFLVFSVRLHSLVFPFFLCLATCSYPFIRVFLSACLSLHVSSLVLPCFIRYLYLLASSSAYLIFFVSIYPLSLLFMSFLIYPFSSSFPRLPVTL